MNRCPDRDGSTVLHHAVKAHNKEDLEELVEGGEDINKVDRCGYTALHQAIVSGKLFTNHSSLSCSRKDDSSRFHSLDDNSISLDQTDIFLINTLLALI